MNSARTVGEIFTKAGESFHKLADMTVLLESNTNSAPVTSTRNVILFTLNFIKKNYYYLFF